MRLAMTPTQKLAWLLIFALCCVSIAYWRAGCLGERI